MCKQRIHICRHFLKTSALCPHHQVNHMFRLPLSCRINKLVKFIRGQMLPQCFGYCSLSRKVLEKPLISILRRFSKFIYNPSFGRKQPASSKVCICLSFSRDSSVLTPSLLFIFSPLQLASMQMSSLTIYLFCS